MLFHLNFGRQHLILLGGEERGEVNDKKNERLCLGMEISFVMPMSSETNLICEENLNSGVFLHL